jgi:Tfp pilus assembly protein PilZ
MEQESNTNIPEQQTSVTNTDPSLLFAKALSFILKNGEGIVVDTNSEVNFSEEVKKVIVFKFSDKIHIYKCDEDIPEGTAVHLEQEEEN